MTAATQARATVRRENLLINKPVSGSATIYAGTMFALLAADGMAVPAGTAASGQAIAVARETVSGGGTDGLNRVDGERGCFKFANSADADEITHAHIGQACYAVDDQTVALTDDEGALSLAGAIADVDADGDVWVQIMPGALGPAGPAGA